MRKVALGLSALGLSGLVFFGASPEPVAAQNACVTVGTLTTCTETVVKEVIKEVPGPVRTIIERVPIPGPTVTVPAPVETVFVPGPTRTVFVDRPGPTRTVTESATPSGQEPTPSGTLAPTTVRPTPTPTVTPSPVVVKMPGDKEIIRVTVPEAVGISLLLIALGSLVFLGIMYIMYIIGHREGEETEKAFLEELRTSLTGRR